MRVVTHVFFLPHVLGVHTHSLPPLSYLTCAAQRCTAGPVPPGDPWAQLPSPSRAPSQPRACGGEDPELRGPLAALWLPSVGVCALCWRERSWLSLHMAARGSAWLLPRGQGGHHSRALLVSPDGPQGSAGGGEGGTEVGFYAMPAWELAERWALPQRVQARAQGTPLRPERSPPTDAGR